MTKEQENKMYDIQLRLNSIRRDLDIMCFYSGDDNLKGDDYNFAREVHSKVCEVMYLL